MDYDLQTIVNSREYCYLCESKWKNYERGTLTIGVCIYARAQRSIYQIALRIRDRWLILLRHSLRNFPDTTWCARRCTEHTSQLRPAYVIFTTPGSRGIRESSLSTGPSLFSRDNAPKSSRGSARIRVGGHRKIGEPVSRSGPARAR